MSDDITHPWQTQYMFGGDYLYLCNAHGVVNKQWQLNTEVMLNPVVATGKNVVYLWQTHDEHNALKLELLDGAKLVLRPELKPFEIHLGCREGEVTLTVCKRKTDVNFQLPGYCCYQKTSHKFSQ